MNKININNSKLFYFFPSQDNKKWWENGFGKCKMSWKQPSIHPICSIPTLFIEFVSTHIKVELAQNSTFIFDCQSTKSQHSQKSWSTKTKKCEKKILLLTFPESASKNLNSNLRMVDLPVHNKQFMHKHFLFEMEKEKAREFSIECREIPLLMKILAASFSILQLFFST